MTQYGTNISQKQKTSIAEWKEYFLSLLFFRNKILKSFDLIITPSEYLKKYFFKKVFNFKIKIISNFSSINYKKFRQKNIINKSYKEKFDLVVISRFVKAKNINYLIEAFKELEDFNLHIYGSGPEEDNYRNQINRNKSKNIFCMAKKE